MQEDARTAGLRTSETRLAPGPLGGGTHHAQQSGEIGDGDLVDVFDRGDDVSAQRFVAEWFGKPMELVHDTVPGHRPGG